MEIRSGLRKASASPPLAIGSLPERNSPAGVTWLRSATVSRRRPNSRRRPDAHVARPRARPMNRPSVVMAAAISPQPWRNGGGQTRELLRWPEDASSWLARISLASVTRSGPFSLYPGVQRWFNVIEGNGVALQVAGQEHRLTAATAPLQFGGDAPVHCDLLDGPTSDLNLMVCGGVGWMQHAVTGETWSCDLCQGGLFTRAPGTLTGSHGAVHDLPAQVLFWLDNACGATFRFDSSGVEQGPPGIWLGFDRL
jgi:uncharacterized protein